MYIKPLVLNITDW